MDKLEFIGELKYVEPNRLLDPNKNDPLSDFFLVLAVVFNDFKGIDFFERLLLSTYRLPPMTEITFHSAEYSGLSTQTRKIFISNLEEFFVFLNKHKEILSSPEFRLILEKTNKTVQNKWNNIVDIATNKKLKENNEFTNYLSKVRNNVAFHYYRPKELKQAFFNFFIKKKKIEQNNLAYYAMDIETKTTRFFYADAAVQEYLRSATGDIEKFNYKYDKEIGNILGDIIFTIANILKVYLKNIHLNKH